MINFTQEKFIIPTLLKQTIIKFQLYFAWNFYQWLFYFASQCWPSFSQKTVNHYWFLIITNLIKLISIRSNVVVFSSFYSYHFLLCIYIISFQFIDDGAFNITGYPSNIWNIKLKGIFEIFFLIKKANILQKTYKKKKIKSLIFWW